MHPDVSSIIYDEQQIDEIVSKIAEKINADYAGRTLLCVGILKGACTFMMDLIRKLPDVDVQVDYMVVSSYGSSATTSGKVNILKDLSRDIAGLDVLIVEDILDTGVTLDYVIPMLKERGPKSVELCIFTKKENGLERAIEPKYLASTCPNEFIVGYGLDYNERYRHLPYVGVLKREIYS